MQELEAEVATLRAASAAPQTSESSPPAPGATATEQNAEDTDGAKVVQEAGTKADAGGCVCVVLCTLLCVRHKCVYVDVCLSLFTNTAWLALHRNPGFTAVLRILCLTTLLVTTQFSTLGH